MVYSKKRKHNKKVDALFINPPSPDGFVYIRDINRHGRSSWERIKWPQTSLAYLAAVAKSDGFTVDIIDCIGENIDWPQFEKHLEICSPKYCLSNIISVTYSNDLRALKTAKRISGAITIGMGPHLTNDPAQSLYESTDLDFVIRNEAENTLKELLQVLENGKKNLIKNLSKVNGLAFLPNRLEKGASKTCVVTEKREFIQDLDELPMPLHELLPLENYWSPLIGKYTFVEASRGCSFRCIFCRQAVMWQWEFRSRSGKKVAEEALYVNSLGINNILFHADTFTLDPQMVNDLCDTLIEKGAPFRWACNTHVKPIIKNPELLKKMRQAGCWMIAIGIESGDNLILKNIKKKITIEEAEKAVKMIHGEGIEAWGYFVLGLPGETKQTLEKTIDTAIKLPLSIAKFDIAAPYPGTEFYKYTKSKGYLSFKDYEDFDQNASAVVEYPGLTREQIKKAARLANRKFFLRPRILWRLAKEIKNIATLQSILMIIRDQIRLLSSGRRQRKDATIIATKENV
jgi:radical SAM superfamily enzyme YgiQ (UPF0313 family)